MKKINNNLKKTHNLTYYNKIKENIYKKKVCNKKLKNKTNQQKKIFRMILQNNTVVTKINVNNKSINKQIQVIKNKD